MQRKNNIAKARAYIIEMKHSYSSKKSHLLTVVVVVVVFFFFGLQKKIGTLLNMFSVVMRYVITYG